MTAEVIPLPESESHLRDRIRTAWERTQRGRQEWIEGTLELAAAMAEGRARKKSNRDFAVWLAENDLDFVSHQERAALINMAAVPNLRAFLQETHRSSYELIWHDIKPHLTSVRNTDSTPPITENTPPIPENARTAPAEKSPAPTRTKLEPLPKRHPFHGRKRAAEVSAVYLSTDARTMLGKACSVRRTGAEIWALILAALDAGFLTPTDTAFEKPSLWILFPNAARTYCRRFDLTKPEHRHTVRDRIMPAALANRDAVLSSSVPLETIVDVHWQRAQQAQRETTHKLKVQDAVRAMASGESQVVMFGEHLWPRVQPRFGTYDYDQLRAAIWYFRDLDNWLKGRPQDNSPKSRAIIIRLTTRWPQQYIERAGLEPDSAFKVQKVYSLIHTLATLMETKPDAECKFPATPKIDGQW